MLHVTSKLGAEAVKIISAKIFLGQLQKCLFNNLPTTSKIDVYNIVVLSPIIEEFLFRFSLLQSIHLIQISITLYISSQQRKKRSEHPLSDLNSCIYDRSNPRSESIEPTNCLPVKQKPFEQRLVEKVEIEEKSSISVVEANLEKKKKMHQQIFRVHLAALIFASAHLFNPHPSKVSALTQFTWSYMGGVIYGYLTEKYHSLAPGILSHGLNNMMAIAIRVHPSHYGLLAVAIIVNRVGSYILAVTPIDRVMISEISKILDVFRKVHVFAKMKLLSSLQLV